MTISKRSGLLLLTGLLTPACVILGVEPDEIDVADETSSGVSTTSNSNSNGLEETGSADTGDGDGDPTGPDDSSTGDGDGDGDGDSSGDGDGDPGDGDGDAGDGGDGDGDGDGDTGTGDGDGESTGDGDGDLVPCGLLDPLPLEEADNQIIIPDVMSSFEGSCGGTGPEAVFSFTATIDASYDFSIWGDGFEGIIYLVGESCIPLDEIACSVEPQSIVYPMLVGQVVYIIADTNNGPGAAQLTVAPI